MLAKFYEDIAALPTIAAYLASPRRLAQVDILCASCCHVTARYDHS